MLSGKKGKDVPNKLSKFLQTTGIINQVLKHSNVHKQTTLLIHYTLAIPTLLYDSETWTLNEQDKSSITAAEMKLLRKNTRNILFDHAWNKNMK
jgi:hypothetical protein